MFLSSRESNRCSAVLSNILEIYCKASSATLAGARRAHRAQRPTFHPDGINIQVVFCVRPANETTFSVPSCQPFHDQPYWSMTPTELRCLVFKSIRFKQPSLAILFAYAVVFGFRNLAGWLKWAGSLGTNHSGLTTPLMLSARCTCVGVCVVGWGVKVLGR